MPELIATAVIVLVVAALTVYAPVARSRRPAHLSTGELTSVPPPQLGNDPISRLVAVLRTRRWARMGLTTLSIGLLVTAVGTIGYPFYTNLYQQRVQERLDRQIDRKSTRLNSSH